MCFAVLSLAGFNHDDQFHDEYFYGTRDSQTLFRIARYLRGFGCAYRIPVLGVSRACLACLRVRSLGRIGLLVDCVVDAVVDSVVH